MQIHELNNFNGTPGATNFLAIDDGSDTSRISGEALLDPVNSRIDNLTANVLPDSVETILDWADVESASKTLTKNVSGFDYLDLYFKEVTSGTNRIVFAQRYPRTAFPAQVTIPVISWGGGTDPKYLYFQDLMIAISGTTLTMSQLRIYSWDGKAADGANIETGILVDQIRVDGVKISSNTSAELTDLRTAHNGTVYASARAAREADYNALDGEIGSIGLDLEKVEDIVIERSINLYNPALQTPETISPHYYVAGAPYPTTQFDAFYNCTAPIPVKPNTRYTIGLVPELSGYVKPWAGAAWGVFYYKEDDTYIDGTADNTFTTPNETAYIRFNYYIGQNIVTLNKLNSNCMLVEGDTLPNEYTGYSYKTLKETKVSKPVWYKRTGTTIEIGYPFSNDKNAVVTMKQTGGNNLFDLYTVDTIPNTSDYVNGSRTQIFGNVSDCFGPYIVGAVNNIDGDDPTHTNFTGGNHQYNNTGTGSTPTARTAAIKFYADKKEILDGESGYCTEVTIKWENRVQGYNTRKADGSGREILKVIHEAILNGDDIKVATNIYPLEDVIMRTFYGYQGFTYASMFPNVRYIGAVNRLVNVGNSESGDMVAYVMKCDDSTNTMYMQMSIDPLLDLGKRAHAAGTNGMFVSYNKCYFCIINQATNMAEGSLYVLKGAYKFATN